MTNTPHNSLSDTEVERYARHLILNEIDEGGQLALKETTVAIVGLGGIGSPVAQYLAASGVGKLRLIDNDSVDLSNLQRQVIHNSNSVGQSKVASAATAIAALNPLVSVETVNEQFKPDHLRDVGLVIDGTDTYESRCSVSAAAVAAEVTSIFASAIGFDGQLAVLDPNAPAGRCFKCLFPAPPKQKRSCSEVGVFAPLLGMVGSMAAGLALRLIIGLPVPINQLKLIDGENFEIQTLNFKGQRAGCPICAINCS